MSETLAFDTAKTYFSFSSATRTNAIIHAIKQIPLVSRLLPMNVYANKGLKTFARVLAVISEPTRLLLGKFIYFAFIAFTAVAHSVLVEDGPIEILPNCALLTFLLFTLAGGFMNLPLFSYSRNLFTAVRSLRMEAKSVMLSYYLYAEATAYVSSLPFTLLLCWLGGLPLWIGVIAPLAPIGMKALVAAFIISHFNRTGVFIPPTKLFGKATTPLSMVLLLAGYVSSIAGFALPLIICVSFMLFITVAGAAVFAIPLRLSPAKFQRLAKEFMTSARADLSATQSSVAQASKSHAAITSLNTSQVGKGRISQLQGLAYLNALFMQRHRKILWRSALRFTAASAAIMVGLIVLAVIFPEPFNDIDYAFSSIAFIMYFVNRGTGFTQALFMNCDHALLTYPFFKKSGMILHLFVLRLRDIVLVNLPTALVIGFGFAVLLGLGNPARPLFDYAIAFFATLLFSIFFSVHYMAMYYLIQPYNAASEQKSALYGIVQAVTYFACWGLIQVHLPLVFLGTLSLGFCAIYCVVAGVLIYRYAPQTFRIKA